MPSDDSPMISSKSREVLNNVRRIVPPLLDRFHKGQLGRVAVIGGSQDYTGAPFFSANASARLGADMSHVICEPDAAQVIKTYSPNLMVHPLMRQSSKTTAYAAAGTYSDADEAAKEVTAMLGRLHAIVVGPGLGRDPTMQATTRQVLLEARKRGLPFVIDADGLMLVNSEPDLVKGYTECVLTPNVVEFGRLAKALDVEIGGGNPKEGGGAEDCERVSRALGGALIVQKGAVDYISNGQDTLVCDLQGGRKRSGGQGDTLTGCIVAMLAWRRAYHDGLWHEGEEEEGGGEREGQGEEGQQTDRSSSSSSKGENNAGKYTGQGENRLTEAETLRLAAFGGAALTRECSRLAFGAHGRALQASDVGDQVARAFLSLIGEKGAGSGPGSASSSSHSSKI